ncbi:MAG: MGMT family protein [Ruminococcaceae bacterium]|nr:MGMT family protein [Oscillospiraceae bacterium]
MCVFNHLHSLNIINVFVNIITGDIVNTFDKIYNVVKKIPKGKVASYGTVAAMAGNPRWSRVVGYALHVNPQPGTIPCHRVVTRNGEVSRAFAFGGENMQRLLLSEEGVEFLPDGRVDMKKHAWSGY